MPLSVRAALLAGTVALAGCTQSMPDFTQFKLPSTRTFLPQNVDTYVPPTSAEARRVTSPEELVDAQGVCAAMVPPLPPQAQESSETATQTPPVTAPLVPRNIGLNMTECDVVRAIGVPQSVNISANEHGERRASLIYMGNQNAGTYEFTSGRLVSLERGELPPPPKEEKKKPVKKKRPAPTVQQQQNQPQTQKQPAS